MCVLLLSNVKSVLAKLVFSELPSTTVPPVVTANIVEGVSTPTVPIDIVPIMLVFPLMFVLPVTVKLSLMVNDPVIVSPVILTNLVSKFE